MSYFASFQLKGLPICKMLNFEVQKNGVTLEPVESDLLDKISLNPKISRAFWAVSHLKDLSFFYSAIF